MRHKSGFNRLWPKYTLQLSDGAKFLLTGKKRSGNTTSNYMITIEQEKMKKDTKGYLGKLRSNFLGTEFYIYDTGKNPTKAKTVEQSREQHGVVQYETNVLGSKGPRRMKVLMPRVTQEGQPIEWKSQDVSEFFILLIDYVIMLCYRKTSRSENNTKQETLRTLCSSSTNLQNGMTVNNTYISDIIPNNCLFSLYSRASFRA